MRICSSCGNQFDGDVCPVCGNVGKKQCPNCGTLVDSRFRFCNKCGCRLGVEPVKAETESANAKIHYSFGQYLYCILRFVPIALIAVFSIVMFALCSLPLVDLSVEGGNIGFGNIYEYSFLKIIMPELGGALIAIFVLLGCGAVYSVIAVAVSLRRSSRYGDMGLKQIPELLGTLSFLIYVCFIIVGIVVIVKVDAAYGEQLVPSAFCWAVPSIAGASALVGVAAYFVRDKLSNNNKYTKLENDRTEAFFVAEEARRRTYYATHAEPEIAGIAGSRSLDSVTDAEWKKYQKEVMLYERATDKKNIILRNSIIIGGAALVVAAILLIVLIPYGMDVSKENAVRSLPLGYGSADVVKLLGEADGETPSGALEYYDRDTAGFVKKAEALSEEIGNRAFVSLNPTEISDLSGGMDLLEQAFYLNRFRYIRISFDATDKIREVLFDTDFCYGDEIRTKTAESVRLGDVELLSSEDVLPCYIEYSDGSFRRTYATDIENLDTYKPGTQFVYWSDSYGAYNATVNVVGRITKGMTFTFNPTSSISVVASAADNGTSMTLPNFDVTVNGSGSIDNDALPKGMSTLLGNAKTLTLNGDIDYAWGNICVNLQSVILSNTVTVIGDNAFQNCKNLTDMEIPGSVIRIGDGAFSGCSGLKSIDLPGGITSIGSGAFSGCSGLKSIDLPGGITSIGSGAFSGCSGLSQVNLPDSITVIERDLFLYCNNLVGVNIPRGVTSIGEKAFYGCDKLTDVQLPDTVTYIGNRAFYDCNCINNVSIPSSVTHIGDDAFSFCDRLTDIYCEAVSRPSGWSRSWASGSYVTVHWSSKP